MTAKQSEIVHRHDVESRRWLDELDERAETNLSRYVAMLDRQHALGQISGIERRDMIEAFMAENPEVTVITRPAYRGPGDGKS